MERIAEIRALVTDLGRLGEPLKNARLPVDILALLRILDERERVASERIKRAENILAGMRARMMSQWPALEMLLGAYEKTYGEVKHG